LLVGEGVNAVELVLPAPPQAVSNNSMNMNVATIVKKHFRMDTAPLIF